MRIAICDDSLLELENTKKLVSSYYQKIQVNVEISCFDNPANLIKLINLPNNTGFDIYFLDVIMQINGIETARKIREVSHDAVIIFTTTSSEFAVDAFTVKAYHYLIKPIAEEQMNAVLDDLSINFNYRTKNTFNFKTQTLNILSIEINEVCFIESIDRRIVIHLITGESITSTALRTKFLDSIPFNYENYNFISCHASFIVNMNHVKAIEDGSFIMKNGFVVPIAKRNFSSIKKEYIKYLIGE